MDGQRIMYQGMLLDPGEDVPDLGTIKCLYSNEGVISFHGLYKDVEKMNNIPKNHIKDGSSVMFDDVGVLFKYHSDIKLWVEFGAGEVTI